MPEIEIDKDVHNEIMRRVAGQTDPVGLYLKGYVDGMVRGADPRDFEFKLVIVPKVMRSSVVIVERTIELVEKAKEGSDGSSESDDVSDKKARRYTSHADCNHPSTRRDREICRKARRERTIPL